MMCNKLHQHVYSVRSKNRERILKTTQKCLLCLYLLSIMDVISSTSWLLLPTPGINCLFSTSVLDGGRFVIFYLDVIVTRVRSGIGACWSVHNMAFRLALLIFNYILIAIASFNNILNIETGNTSTSRNEKAFLLHTRSLSQNLLRFTGQ